MRYSHSYSHFFDCAEIKLSSALSVPRASPSGRGSIRRLHRLTKPCPASSAWVTIPNENAQPDASSTAHHRLFQGGSAPGALQGARRSCRQPRPVSPASSKPRRHQGGQAVGKLKRFKRIAPRCEKTARNYGSFVALACAFILIKPVHTA